MTLITVHGEPVSFSLNFFTPSREKLRLNLEPCGGWVSTSGMIPRSRVSDKPCESETIEGDILMILGAEGFNLFSILVTQDISVMKYNKKTIDVVADVSSIFSTLDQAVQEANVLLQNAGGELS